jgi:prolyl 4-hydroxylase
VEEGGETTLPLAEAINEEAQKLDHPSECAAKMGISVRPRKGDALLFFDLDIMGSVGQRSALHASCPTLKVGGWLPVMLYLDVSVHT